MKIVLSRREIASVLTHMPLVMSAMQNKEEKRLATKLTLQMQHAMARCEREFVIEGYAISLLAPALVRHYGVTFESILRTRVAS